MTAIQDPSSAKVFVVGYNPAKAYLASALDHERHIDALFNRNGETCRGLYSELSNESPSRGNIEMLTTKMAKAGVTSVLETNSGGKSRGSQIFRALVREVRPKTIVLHGVGVRNEFNRAFSDEVKLPLPQRVAVVTKISAPSL